MNADITTRKSLKIHHLSRRNPGIWCLLVLKSPGLKVLKYIVWKLRIVIFICTDIFCSCTVSFKILLSKVHWFIGQLWSFCTMFILRLIDSWGLWYKHDDIVMPICNWYVLQELKERVLKGKFSVPFYVPSDLQRLIKKFLVLNPSKRITLEVIKTFFVFGFYKTVTYLYACTLTVCQLDE